MMLPHAHHPDRRDRADRRWAVREAVILLLALTCLCRTGRAQDEEEDWNAIAIQKVGGHLFVEGRHRRDDETRRGNSANEVETLLNEGIELNTRGYFYHPNLVDWLADLQFGGTHNWLELDSGSQDTSGILLGYNFNAFILKEKPLSGRVFARKNSQFIDRSFGRGIDLDSSSEGAEIRLAGRFPALFSYRHIAAREESEFRIDDQDSHLFRFNISDARDPAWLTELDYEHEDVEKTTHYLGAASFIQDYPDHRDELTIRNDWLFGTDEHPHRLTGRFRLLDRRGFYEDQLLSLEQYLELVHTPTFATFYSASGTLQETDVQEIREFLASAGFRKSFYESLRITGTVTGRHTGLRDGSDAVYGGILALDYTKETPIGQYSSGLALSRHYEHEESDAGQRRFDGSQITLTGTTFVALPQANVVPGSIIVTDVTRTILYIQGLDYELQTLGAVTEIRRLIGGTITDPQTVLVSFTAQAAFDAEFTTDRIEWSHRLDFKHLPAAVYFTYRRLEQQLESGDDPGNLDLSQSWLVGTEWDFWGFNIVGEHERRDERLTLSSTIDRARISYTNRISRDMVFTSGAHYQMLVFDDVPPTELDFVESYGVYANLTVKPLQNLLLRPYGDFNSSRGRQKDTRARLGAALQWHYGRMDVFVDGYYSVYEQSGSEGNTAYLGFKVRRNF